MIETLINFLKPQTLPFAIKDYEPYISAEIMKIHYEKHYLGYLKKFNEIIEMNPEIEYEKIEDILKKINFLPNNVREGIKNNAGGVSNHEIFWQILNPLKPSETIPFTLSRIIYDFFGDEFNFKQWIFRDAINHFGSGWVWLVMDKNMQLKIYTLPNQDSPYINGHIPILGIDLWEHAYYLQYKNLRMNYLEEVWKIIDWKIVEENYYKAKAKFLHS